VLVELTCSRVGDVSVLAVPVATSSNGCRCAITSSLFSTLWRHRSLPCQKNVPHTTLMRARCPSCGRAPPLVVFSFFGAYRSRRGEIDLADDWFIPIELCMHDVGPARQQQQLNILCLHVHKSK
jgi:hypothetical protein